MPLLAWISLSLHVTVILFAMQFFLSSPLSSHLARTVVATCGAASAGCLLTHLYMFLWMTAHDAQPHPTTTVWVAFSLFNGAFYLALVRGYRREYLSPTAFHSGG